MRNNLPGMLVAAAVLLAAGCSDEDSPVHSDPPVIVDQDLWYVNSAASGAGTGSSWRDAFTSIHKALEYASDGDIIWVAAGTYGCPVPGDSSVPVVEMKQGVDIYGGFSPGDTSMAQRDPESNRTILDGENRVWHTVTGADRAKLDGFTIQSGYAYGAYPHNCGGGMLNFHASPEVSNCIFTSNDAGFHGAGMANIHSSASVTGCVFRLNLAANNGAGAYNEDQPGSHGHPRFDDCTFGPGNSCRFGGGMYNSWCEVTVEDCVFRDNLANHNGGGLYNTSSKATVKRCVFTENRAYDGGAVYMNGIAGEDLSRLENCLVFSNVAYVSGGGVYLLRSSATLINCTIAENASTYAGGISCWHSEASFLNTIVWGNVATNTWPAIEIGTEVLPEIQHCDIDQDGYGIEGDGSADMNGNIRLDPLFVTGPRGDWYLSHSSAGQGADSPCIDAGTASSIGAWLSGLTTRTDGAPDSGNPDIGFHYSP
jgi:hypothetical protein